MLSIVIPVFNKFSYTLGCINSIESTYCDVEDVEIIIVDNGSTDGTVNALKDMKDVRVVVNEKNLGFAKAVNQGIRESRGEVIVILNNDTIVTNWWLDRLLNHLDEVDIAVPSTNFALGMQKVRIGDYEDGEGLNEAVQKWTVPNVGILLPVNWAIGLCMAFRASLWEDVGGFDERYEIGCAEDLDFCITARMKGYQIGIARDVYIHHHGSVTINSVGVDVKQLLKVNNGKLLEKFGEDVIEKYVVQDLREKEGLRLNLGCGYSKMQGYVNIDSRPEVLPDIVLDVMKGLPYEDGTVDEVVADDFLEHIPVGSCVGVVEEIYRVLKPNGSFNSLTPSTESRAAFQDPFHVSWWNQNSFFYYTKDVYRNLYGIRAKFTGHVETVWTDMENHICHVRATLRAVKE